MIQINLTFCGPVILMIWMECTQRNRLGRRTSENNTTTKHIVGPFQGNLALFTFTQRGILILNIHWHDQCTDRKDAATKYRNLQIT